MESRTTQLRPVAPFDFDLTAGSHTYFRGTYGADMLEGGDYRRLLNIDNRLVLAHVRSTGSTTDPKLSVVAQGPHVSESDLAAVSDIMGWNLGIDADMEGFYQSVKGEPVLERISITTARPASHSSGLRVRGHGAGDSRPADRGGRGPYRSHPAH